MRFQILMFIVVLSLSNVFNPSTFSNYSKSNLKNMEVENRDLDDCSFNGIPLYGKVQFVTSFPDIKIQFVESFPDIKVQFVESFPDDCGQWQIVESFPDFTVQVVESFPDIKVETVNSFPGI